MRGAQSGTKRRWRPWRLALACLALLFSCFSDSSSAFLEAGAASRRRSMTLQWFAASLLGELPAVAEGENVDLGYEKMDRLKGSLAKKRTKMPDFTPLPSGLQIKDADPGRVGMPAAKEGDYVVFTWEGYTINYFGRPFETRTLQKMSGIDPDPVRFRVGDGKVIKGIDEGVRGMHEGGIRQLIVPVELSSQVGPRHIFCFPLMGLQGMIFQKPPSQGFRGPTLFTMIIRIIINSYIYYYHYHHHHHSSSSYSHKYHFRLR